MAELFHLAELAATTDLSWAAAVLAGIVLGVYLSVATEGRARHAPPPNSAPSRPIPREIPDDRGTHDR